MEIVGSVLHIKKHQLTSATVPLAINLNGVGINAPITVSEGAVAYTSLADCYLHLFYRLGLWEVTHILGFRQGWGNDEIAFHVPGVEIPCSSIYRAPFPQYHSSADNLKNFSFQKLQDTIELLIALIYVIDNNYMIDSIHIDSLPCMASPELSLYLEPGDISGIGQATTNASLGQIYDSIPEKDLHTLGCIIDRETLYIGSNAEFMGTFMNRLMSVLTIAKGRSIFWICEQLSSPPLFTLSYLMKMQAKGLLKLSDSINFDTGVTRAGFDKL